MQTTHPEREVEPTQELSVGTPSRIGVGFDFSLTFDLGLDISKTNTTIEINSRLKHTDKEMRDHV